MATDEMKRKLKGSNCQDEERSPERWYVGMVKLNRDQQNSC